MVQGISFGEHENYKYHIIFNSGNCPDDFIFRRSYSCSLLFQFEELFSGPSFLL